MCVFSRVYFTAIRFAVWISIWTERKKNHQRQNHIYHSAYQILKKNFRQLNEQEREREIYYCELSNTRNNPVKTDTVLLMNFFWIEI